METSAPEPAPVKPPSADDFDLDEWLSQRKSRLSAARKREQPFGEFLEQFIVDELIHLQIYGQWPVVRNLLRGLLDPRSSRPYYLLAQAFLNMSVFNRMFRQAKKDRNVYPWVFAPAAAAAFEAVYETSVLRWLKAGPPDVDHLDELAPCVNDFVQWQVCWFALTVGAEQED